MYIYVKEYVKEYFLKELAFASAAMTVFSWVLSLLLASTSALSFSNFSPVPVADGSWQPAPLPLSRSASLAPAAFGWPRRQPGASSRSFPLALAAFASQSRWFAYVIVADGICRARHGREPEVRSIYM